MPPRCAPFFIITVAVAAILVLAACGSEAVDVDSESGRARRPALRRALLEAATRFEAAGALGSVNRVVRNQGPNLDERAESPEDVLYAIQNGGFSGAIMPQQIVTGEDAQAVADFVAKYSGTEIDRPTRPSPKKGTRSIPARPPTNPLPATRPPSRQRLPALPKCSI